VPRVQWRVSSFIESVVEAREDPLGQHARSKFNPIPLPKGGVAPITSKYCHSIELLSGLLQSEAITTKP